jgi:hypothetical protein
MEIKESNYAVWTCQLCQFPDSWNFILLGI